MIVRIFIPICIHESPISMPLYRGLPIAMAGEITRDLRYEIHVFGSEIPPVVRMKSLPSGYVKIAIKNGDL